MQSFSAPELAETLGGPGAVVRALRAAAPSPGRDARLLALLDGQHGLAQAASLAGAPAERAAALALVFVAFGQAASIPGANSTEPWPEWRTSRGSPASPGAAEPWPERRTSSGSPAAPGSSDFARLAPTRPARRPHAALLTLAPAVRLRALAELVRTSDYFTILGVDTRATKAAVDEAHHQLRGLIDVEDYARDPDLLRLAREVIRSLDEARDVLRVPELRSAYQLHLDR